ncbi:M20 family metallo-hydrolase [Aspergillus saccharolyticus JOP 1030-1]|uniref:Beta-alanine synthase n=1 Tax=Aspergillus saccharolyticus JOP 1030-1 TaxID=1450539 RepID=A0A319ACZ4_9EURO|nr:beta-alanine synthase [Aspergillus saccharolyticus JOP 1030-1]PYH49458.1 beta-alanine synthase [Aspergillus saccharolyticus JOP 1030-1]
MLTRPIYRGWTAKSLRRQLSSQAGSGLKINSDRLLETLHHTCQWGAAHRYGDAPTETGMNRLCLTDDDARVRRWLLDEAEKLGCSPRGGRYDGILGVIAALEVLRTMKDQGYQTQFDVGLVNWTNEEGARFPKSMCSSGVWAGEIPLEKAWNLSDIFNPSVTLRSELKRHGFLGDTPCSPAGYPLGAHFELHIEQGPILEDANKKIGLVTGAQGYRWLSINVTGRDAHTGTTPLRARRDPLLAASKMIAASNAIAKQHGALASTGVLKLPPTASTKTVASEVTFTLDIRHPRDSVVHAVQDECLSVFAEIAREDGKGVTFDWTLDTDSPAVQFDANCLAAVKDAATQLVDADGWLEITSGAGHDTVYTSRHCPTAMIFVPCKEGVSHHPEEYCKPEDCALGTQTLLEAVVNYDRMRSKLK